MRLALVAAVLLFASLAFAPDAEAGTCVYCMYVDSYTSMCSSFNGPIPNCYNYCWGGVCQCNRTFEGVCDWSEGRGEYRFARVQSVRILPVDASFETTHRVVRVEVTRSRRGAA